MGNKIFEIGLNCIFWFVTAWLISSSFSIQSQELEVVNGVESIKIYRNSGIVNQLLLCVLLAAVAFYINFILLFKYFKNVKLWQSLIFTLALPIVAYIIFSALSPIFSKLQVPNGLIVGIIIFYHTISCAYALCKMYIQAEIKHKTLLFEKKNMELSLLRRQLQPHFLFNALNNLLSLVNQKQNPELARALDKLSALLRYVVYDTENEKIAIGKEIEFIKNFCELQMLRFEKDEVAINFSVDGKNSIQVEPGIFIPFVENAFKYGIEPEKHSQIDIKFNLETKNKIFFSISNPIFDIMQQQKGTGTGIKNTKERLKLVYPNGYKLTIDDDKNTFNVSLNINIDENNNY